MRETPSAHARRAGRSGQWPGSKLRRVAGFGRGGGGRERTVRHALHQADVEANLVPLHDGPLNLEEGQGNRGLPILGAFEDQVVELVTDLGLSQSK